ncbi:MAG: alkaline phosphatase family protein [Myxococcota bacterium]|nr:alkaline phosphatase family protein [Myxococcota bacterium]
MTIGAGTSTTRPRARSIFALAAALATVGCAGKGVKLVMGGDSHELRKRPQGSEPNSPGHPAILVLAFDGVDRALLYETLHRGDMPGLAGLLGGVQGSEFPHAYFDPALLSTLPSTTMAAWVTAFTGVGPAHHGVTGNEFFIREERRLAAPAPATFNDHDPVISIYTDQYLNRLCVAPSVYERMRLEDPNVLVWVAMQQFYAGADRLLLTKPTVVVEAFQSFVEEAVTKLATQKETRAVYQKLDEQIMDVVVGALDAGPIPDVLTVYLSGTDLYAHVAAEGPDAARRRYLREVVDPQMQRLAEKLRARRALDGRYVVVTSDHGHTEVLHDEVHALTTKDEHTPPALLRKAGFRLRPFKLDVAKDDDFQAVLTYQGAMAYIYVADRSTCTNAKTICDWVRPPRYEEDVLPVADAFYRNNEDGSLVPELKGTLDMILTRRPRPFAEEALPFQVYVGGGNVVPIEKYLAENPHPTYVDVPSRLRELGVGPHGERAGDVILLAHDGDRDAPAQRYYFAEPYHSWHGSPSRKDSEIPLIVARAGDSTEAIRRVVDRALGEHPHQQKITDLLLSLRRLPRSP